MTAFQRHKYTKWASRVENQSISWHGIAWIDWVDKTSSTCSLLVHITHTDTMARGLLLFLTICGIFIFFSLLSKYSSSKDPWIEEQQARKLQVDAVCAAHGPDLHHPYVPLYDPEFNTTYLIYIPQLHLLYCNIPKAGSTTWLQGTLMKEAERLGVPHLKNSKQRRNFLVHFKIKDTQTLNNILKTNPVSFNNVRHPFERLVSSYLEDDNGELNQFKRAGFEQFVTEHVLIPANSSQDKKTMFILNHHWRPFNSYCAFCDIDYTILSKTETFDEDRKRIMDIMGLESQEPEQRLNMHSGDSIGDLTSHFFRNVSTGVKLALIDLYQYDFEMFNYDPHLY